MAKRYRTKYHDKEGEKEERRFQNGIVETLLLEPSQWYVDNRLIPAQEARQEEEKQREQRLKVQRKMREMAEKELEKEEEG